MSSSLELEIAHFDSKPHQFFCLLEILHGNRTLICDGEESARWRDRQREWPVAPDHLANLILVFTISQVIHPSGNGVLKILVNRPPTFELVGLCLGTRGLE